jgi:ribose transport system substrate-binding protein
MRTSKRVLLPLALVSAVVAAGCGTSTVSGNRKEVQVSKQIAKVSTFRGPNGEKATLASQVGLTPDEVQKLRDGHYTVAVAWCSMDPAVVANDKGIRDRLGELGIRVATRTDANFDTAKQRDQYAAAFAKKPNAIITLPCDPDVARAGLRPFVQSGIKIVFEENIATGYKYGQDYSTVVATDYNSAAEAAAAILAKSLNGSGKIGYIFHDDNFFITNEWDRHFKEVIAAKYPGIKIVATGGFADPYKVEDVANAMLLRHPDIKGIYATWHDPVEGVLSALRSSGRTDVNVVGVGMSEQVGLDMARRGSVVGMGAAQFYDEGRLDAEMVGYALLGKKAPPLVVSQAFAITRSNLADGYKKMYGIPAPASILNALKQ